FVGASPDLPVWLRVISCPMLGAAVASFDEAGNPVRDQLGELVLTKPMPSMPVFLWNDPDGSRLRSAYFDTYPRIWRHGDWVASVDEAGHPVRDRVGEPVLPKPMPARPVVFWNDPDGSRLRSAYFDTYPGIWRHGDWVEITDRETLIIYGRSDSTLNRGGVRM